MICVAPDRAAGNGAAGNGAAGNGDGAAAATAAVQDDTDVKTWLARLHPHSQWARDGLLPADIGVPVEMPPGPQDLARQQVAVALPPGQGGIALQPMGTDAKGPACSLGVD